ncbi:MAG TPA: GAF domain-containing protein [Anaerolineales bacterium]|nr:GAF domain-containing protein [Anaerolineales bacterium]
MNLDQSSRPSEFEQNHRKVTWWLGALPALLYAVLEVVALLARGNAQVWSVLSVLPIIFAAPIAYLLIRSNREGLGNFIFITAIGLQTILISMVQRGASVPTGIIALSLIIATGLGTLPRKYIRFVITIGFFVAIASILIDTFGSFDRPAVQFAQGRWIFAGLMLILSAVFIIRQLSLLDIRTKIVLGIIGTGGLALVALVAFAFLRTQQIAAALSARLDESVSQLSVEQLINTARSEAGQANQAFEDIEEEVVSLAQNWILLRNEKRTLSQGSYWDASSSLIELEGGQYGNSATDPSSVFVPMKAELDDAVIEDLNVSAYLDFYAPQVLETHPALLAVYAIDVRGITRYYPNISLASLLPPDFDATHRPHYTISSPLFNPHRMARWTIPYVDATGGGMVVTVAAPVYEGDEFRGIVAADMQLTEITQQINAIKVGETGYAFMLDDAGRILAMPPAGFEMFGVRQEDINGEDFFKQTVLGLGSPELQAVTKRMTSGGNGLLIVNVDGVDTYISFSPIQANGYSVGLVVPVSELQGAIISARNQTQQQIRTATQGVVVLLILLLVMAVTVSLALGKIIAAPIQRLTQVASQIAGGDLTAQADAATRDEIGTLASAFNTMTARLRETLDGLEFMVQERTAELLSANEKNERRARQFESIAQVARTISSTSDLDILLPQITNAISREFGFYHVGIFLLDAAKEYAVLSAANSEGGRRMLLHSHRLKVGETGIVGYVTGTGKPRVALDTGADAAFFNNPDLPTTRSEMALPLRVGDEIIGALDVQSTEPNAFSQEDISILSTLADQVSIAIQNAQRFEQTRKALSEAEALAKQFVQVGWQRFTKNKNLIGVRHTGARSTLLYGKNGPDKDEKSWHTEQDRPKSRGAILSLPIKLRGEVIGSVDVRSPDNRPWDQDELDIVTAILERAAIAMDNARLLEESQRLASKEAKISEVTAKISSSINMRNVLQTAVEELGRALPGSDVVIQFEAQPGKNKSAK